MEVVNAKEGAMGLTVPSIHCATVLGFVLC